MAKPPPIPGLPRHPSEAPDLGKRGKYRVISRVGRWVVGNVYSGERLEDQTACTVLFPDVLPKDIRAFTAEVSDEIARNRLLAGLPIVGPAYVGQTTDRRVFLVLPDCSGISLEQRIRERGPLNPGAAMQLAVLLSDALTRLHYRARYIGEIRPWMVLLPVHRHQRWRLLDLGISRGVFARTIKPPRVSPNYSSPAVREGAAPDAQDDVYALGALIYYMLTGHPAAPSGGMMPSRRNPALGAFQGYLDGIVLQATAPDPARNIQPYDSMLSMSRTLRGLRDLYRLTPAGQKAVLRLRSEQGQRPPPVPGASPLPANALGFVESDGPSFLTQAELESIEGYSFQELEVDDEGEDPQGSTQ